MTKPNLPRYTTATRNKNGSYRYMFNPSVSLIEAGLARRVSLGSDVRRAKQLAKKLLKELDKKKAEYDKDAASTISKSATVSGLVDHYLQSKDFLMLREKTQKDYKYCLSILCDSLGHEKFATLSGAKAKAAYDAWLDRGVSLANHVSVASTRVFNYAIELDVASSNPFKRFKRKGSKQRTVVWTHDYVVRFLDTAYSHFKYRNVGLIVHMAYEWAQRIGDMRMLKWDSIDFNSKQLKLEQSKRSSLVYLPIGDNLLTMLKQQRDEFGFQQYVVPSPHAIAGGYKPYTVYRVSRVGKEIMKAAGLPDELLLMDLRRTAVTQMVDAGVPITQIMSVTGHQSMQSVRPYMKHTLASATSALSKRDVQYECS